MSKEVRQHVSLIGAYFRLNLSSAMEYRTSFIVQVFGMFLNNLSFAFFWWMLFERFESIGGYGFDQVMLLWAFSSTGFGVCFILFGNLNYITEMVIKGELDTYLLQPKNVLINLISSKTRISAWGDVAYGVILFFIIEGVSLRGTGMLIVCSVTAAMIYSGFLVLAHSLAFYFGNTAALSTLAFEFIITLSIYPADMFQGVIRIVLFTILPAGFISMIPVSLVGVFDFKLFLLLIGVSILWIVMAFVVFYKGLKKYESGNLMVQKL